jgi:hypothetical protein
VPAKKSSLAAKEFYARFGRPTYNGSMIDDGRRVFFAAEKRRV